MSSEIQQRFESLQREFSAYAEHVMTQAPKPKSKSKPNKSQLQYFLLLRQSVLRLLEKEAGNLS